MPIDIVAFPVAPGQTVTTNMVGGAARLSTSTVPPLDCPPLVSSSPTARNWARRMLEAIMPTSPARVIPLVQPTPRVRPSADWPLARYVQWWLEVGASDRAIKTRQTYEYALRHVTSRIGDVPLGDLTTLDFQAIVSELRAAGRPESSIYITHAAVSSVLGDAVRRYGILSSNPASGVPIRRSEPPERTVLTPEQVARLLSYMVGAPRFLPSYAVIAVMLQTGARIMEAAAPRIVDLALDGPDPEVRILHQAMYTRALGWHRAKTKNRRGKRTIPLPAGAVSIIRRRLELHAAPPTGDDWALGTTTKRPCSDTAIASALVSICTATGTPIIHPHECRTSYLTNLARAGVDLATLAMLAGDTQQTVAEHYLKTDAGAARAAVARVFGLARTEPGLTTP